MLNNEILADLAEDLADLAEVVKLRRLQPDGTWSASSDVQAVVSNKGTSQAGNDKFSRREAINVVTVRPIIATAAATGDEVQVAGILDGIDGDRWLFIESITGTELLQWQCSLAVGLSQGSADSVASFKGEGTAS